MSLYSPPNDNSNYDGWEQYFTHIDTEKELFKAIDTTMETEVWSYTTYKDDHFWIMLHGGYSYFVALIHKVGISGYSRTHTFPRQVNEYGAVYNDYNHYISLYWYHESNGMNFQTRFRPVNYYDFGNGKILYKNYPDGTGNYPLSKYQYMNRIIKKWRKNRVNLPPPRRQFRLYRMG